MPLTDLPTLLERLEQGTPAGDDVRVLEELAAAVPAHVTTHLALARACELGGRWEQARRCWQRAYLLQPGSPAVHAGLQRTAHRLGHAAPAKEESRSVTQQKEAAPPRTEPKTESKPAAPRHEDNDDVAPETPAPEKAPPRKEAPPEEEAPPAERAEAATFAPESSIVQNLAASLPNHEDEDLDSLIEELEGARIDPTPDPDDVPAPNLDTDDHDMVSPTLARIYEAQGQYAEAARVHRRLAEQRPAHADEHRRQAEDLQARAEEEAHTASPGREGDGSPRG